MQLDAKAIGCRLQTQSYDFEKSRCEQMWADVSRWEQMWADEYRIQHRVSNASINIGETLFTSRIEEPIRQRYRRGTWRNFKCGLVNKLVNVLVTSHVVETCIYSAADCSAAGYSAACIFCKNVADKHIRFKRTFHTCTPLVSIFDRFHFEL